MPLTPNKIICPPGSQDETIPPQPDESRMHVWPCILWPALIGALVGAPLFAPLMSVIVTLSEENPGKSALDLNVWAAGALGAVLGAALFAAIWLVYRFGAHLLRQARGRA